MLQALLPHTTVTALSLNSHHTGLTSAVALPAGQGTKEETLSHTDMALPK